MGDVLSNLLLLHEQDEIIEIRSVEPKPSLSGYFRADSPNIEMAISQYPGRTFYQVMNPIDPALYGRAQHERLVQNPKQATSDTEILGYRWVLIDCDPVRPAGISATDSEKLEAKRVANRVRLHLKQIGFRDPVIADSGNGYHLLYQVSIDVRYKDTIERFLKVIDKWFSSEDVSIDTSVFNTARITKLYGTVAHKGANTPDRPHRQSRILMVPPVINKTPFALFQKVASEYVPEVRQSSWSTPCTDFDAEDFLETHGVSIKKRISFSGGTKLILEECPFDHNHKAPDSAVFLYNDGSIGFKCFHNSCSDHGWHDLREKLDPEAYSNSMFSPNKYTEFPRLTTPEAEPVRPRSKMLLFGEIEDYDRSKIIVIKSRFASIDAKIGGFNKGELSIWSGGNASGKSTLVSQLGLEAVHQGFKVAMFSGEMTPSRVKNWLSLQAAGRENVEIDPMSPMHYRLKAGIQEQLDRLLGDKIAVYDNDFGTDWQDVSDTIFSWTQRNNADCVIIDNLMALNLPTGNVDKYEMQSNIVKTVSRMAKQLNIHVHFICHPRKTTGFLRKTDISGTQDLSNAADNVFMMHRVNTDFRAHVKEAYPRLDFPADVGNAVEIMKNRDLGVCDEMIGLFFDKTCKTMSDIKGGLPMHGWSDKLFTPIDDPDCPF